MINLLELIKDEAEKPQFDRVVFRNTLITLGCDDETIADCLQMPCNHWEWLIHYFEDKK